MAYVLGFFAADGWITHNKRGANFWCIQITDKKLLNSIKNVIQSDHAIGIRNGKKKSHSVLYRLQIGNLICFLLSVRAHDEADKLQFSKI